MKPEQLNELLSKFTYEESTGRFFWKSTPDISPKVRGKEVGTTNTGYRKVHVFGKVLRIHRLVWFVHHGVWPVGEIDHINGIRNDNRISNLREASREENGRNRPLSKNNSSGINGVVFNKRLNKWQAQIFRSGKNYHLGTYISIDDAIAARAKATQQYHGEFARNV